MSTLSNDTQPAVEFLRKVSAEFFDDCGDLEYWRFLEIGEETGVLVTEPYDPDRHGEQDLEPGDSLYFLAPQFRAPEEAR